MLKIVLLVSAAALVSGQGGILDDLFHSGLVDVIHGFDVIRDVVHNIVFFSNDTDCYIVEVGRDAWDKHITSDNDVYQFTDYLYNKIQTNTDVTPMTHHEVQTYHSDMEGWECYDKDLHKLELPPLPTDIPSDTTTNDN